MKIEASRIKELFDYREDGFVVWKINTGKKRLIGVIAGCPRGPDGYQRVGIMKKDYYIHHIVWAWHHGKWPNKHIDHANGDPRDNRIENLREATQSQNIANSKGKKSRGIVKGVSPVRGASTWNAHIMVNYKQINLGNYPTQEAAQKAYLAAAKQYFGEFARAS